MPRPRVHDPDRVLDAVESLAARSGPTAVTIRAISEATGVSNGAVYHGFGSRAGLVGAAWLRAARNFLAVQGELVSAAPEPTDAVIAAADAPVAFAELRPTASKLLSVINRDELIDADLPAELAAQLGHVDAELIGLLIRLAAALWDRRDAAAVDTITTCVVDLPTAIVLSRDRLGSPTARAQLHAAVRAVLSVGPTLKGSTP
ncbi:TetR/AcrR family transcriptional regulator [Mycolicibacter sp. MYC123]|uniref:TetR/AcrR family transcriptional regulator n=1 Tax=[Mycobacterium] zoologicum TaxID=2872311 RepID=A0ABU5YPM5_9MYCO|nr:MULTISPECIES: TetR/AcrR family transcriptional regulator [unclassified Mycolicibacter]MEB3052026.1 TetR/AcrR family transcriptional regulator [Mycolicibacter sp. MYC123]MEB3063986.1 TetR/AcrR family transcriptional regulator [Mycolicibacter sp. MYC101]